MRKTEVASDAFALTRMPEIDAKTATLAGVWKLHDLLLQYGRRRKIKLSSHLYLRPNPCLNNGRCRVIGRGGFACECPPSRTGPRCRLVDHCYRNPCRNGGTCINNRDGIALHDFYFFKTGNFTVFLLFNRFPLRLSRFIHGWDMRGEWSLRKRTVHERRYVRGRKWKIQLQVLIIVLHSLWLLFGSPVFSDKYQILWYIWVGLYQQNNVYTAKKRQFNSNFPILAKPHFAIHIDKEVDWVYSIRFHLISQN